MIAAVRPGGAALAALVKVSSISPSLMVVWPAADPPSPRMTEKRSARRADGLVMLFCLLVRVRLAGSIPSGVGERLLATGADDLCRRVEADQVVPVAGLYAFAIAPRIELADARHRCLGGGALVERSLCGPVVRHALRVQFR